jgi:hypothetical protein
MSQPPVDPGLLAYTFALEAASQGLSANAFLTSMREAGMGMRRSVGLELYGLAKRTLAETGRSAFTEPGVVPDPAGFGATLTRGAEGFLQHVRLVYREQVTGRVIERHYSVKTQTPVTPQEAVDQAVNGYADAADRYRQSLVGAIYTGGTRLVPFEVA